MRFLLVLRECTVYFFICLFGLGGFVGLFLISYHFSLSVPGGRGFVLWFIFQSYNARSLLTLSLAISHMAYIRSNQC